MAKRATARFNDADDSGFIAASAAEVDGIILGFLSEQASQKAVNRRILVGATRRQILGAGGSEIAYRAFLDWRGRLYYHGAGLAPQGKDFGRGCLMAGAAGRLGVSGLKHLICGVATTWGQGGLDKARLRDRVKGVVAMVRDGSLRRIVEQATEGTGYEWRLAEEPTQFLAVAADLLAALDSGNALAYESAVFVGYDATCSGLQILAAVTGCEKTARLVNVVPREDGARADIYMSGGEALKQECAAIVAALTPEQLADAEAALALVEAAETERLAAREEGREPDQEILEAGKVPVGYHWALYWHRAGNLNRNLMKKPVMVYCYGGSKRTFAGAFREESRAPWGACMWLAALLYDGVLATMLPRAHAFMTALQGMAKTLAKAGKPVEFTAADGLPFRQAVMETEDDLVNVSLADGRRMKFGLLKRKDTLDSGKQASGIAPNIVHHWDSLFLRNVARAFQAAGIRYWFSVHDCFYLRACDWSKGWKILRRVFIETFAGDVAAEVWRKIEEQSGVQLPPCPPKGDLNLAGVMRSEFLFS